MKSTTFFSDYRRVEGLMYPLALRSSSGQEQYDLFVTVESVEFNEPMEEGLFSMPAPPPPDHTLSGRATPTTVPFHLLNNHIYVEFELGGRGPYLVLCGTGGANVITPTVADRLGLEPEGAFEARKAGEETEKVSMVMYSSPHGTACATATEIRTTTPTSRNDRGLIHPIEYQ